MAHRYPGSGRADPRMAHRYPRSGRADPRMAHRYPEVDVRTLAWRIDTPEVDVRTLAWRIDTPAVDVRTLVWRVDTIAVDLRTFAWRMETRVVDVRTFVVDVRTIVVDVRTLVVTYGNTRDLQGHRNSPIYNHACRACSPLQKVVSQASRIFPSGAYFTRACAVRSLGKIRLACETIQKVTDGLVESSQKPEKHVFPVVYVPNSVDFAEV